MNACVFAQLQRKFRSILKNTTTGLWKRGFNHYCPESHELCCNFSPETYSSDNSLESGGHGRSPVDVFNQHSSIFSSSLMILFIYFFIFLWQFTVNERSHIKNKACGIFWALFPQIMAKLSVAHIVNLSAYLLPLSLIYIFSTLLICM